MSNYVSLNDNESNSKSISQSLQQSKIDSLKLLPRSKRRRLLSRTRKKEKNDSLSLFQNKSRPNIDININGVVPADLRVNISFQSKFFNSTDMSGNTTSQFI